MISKEVMLKLIEHLKEVELNKADEELMIKLQIFTSVILIYESGGMGYDFNVASFILYRFLLLRTFALQLNLFAFKFNFFVTSNLVII